MRKFTAKKIIYPWSDIWFIWEKNEWYPLYEWVIIEELWDNVKCKVFNQKIWNIDGEKIITISKKEIKFNK